MKVLTPEMIDKIHNIVFSYQRITMRKIIEATGITQGRVFSVLHENLKLKKYFALPAVRGK